MSLTQHATTRMQQRGIPPMVDQLLDLYGQEEYDGHGAVTLYLNKTSIRNMERDLGRRPVALVVKIVVTFLMLPFAEESCLLAPG